MSSKTTYLPFFSIERNEVKTPSHTLLTRVSSLGSSIATHFFTSLNFFLSSFNEEKGRAYRFLLTTPHLQTIKNIFISKQPEKAVEEKKEIKILADLIRREEKTPLNTDDSPILYEKKDSLLKKEGRNAAPNINTFSSLFGLNDSLSTTSFKELVDYVGNYFILQTKTKLSPSLFPALKEAVAQKGELEKLIADGDQKALQIKAEQLAKSMETIKVGKPFIYIGNISKGENSNPILKALVNQTLPSDLRHLSEADLLQNTLQKKLSELFKNATTISDLLKHKEELTRTMESGWNGISSSLGWVLPESWVKVVQDSIKDDCREIMFGPDSLSGVESFAEKLWNSLNENEIETMLKTSLEDFCTKGTEILRNGAKEITNTITKSFPPEAMTFLRALDFNGAEATISIEIERQMDGKLRLLIFSEPTDHHSQYPKGVQLPLVYSDLDPKVLGKEFFFRLLSYQAFPKWDKTISYSLDDFFEGLIATLGKEPSKEEKKSLVPLSTCQVITNWTLTELLLRYNLKLDEKELQKTLYDLRLQAFLDMWNEANVKQNLLQSALDSLIKDSIILFEENLLPLDALKAIYATSKEWEEMTKKLEVPQDSLPKTTLPPLLQKGLGEMLSSCEITNGHIELVKEVFSDLFGKEIEEPLQFAIDEIIPTLTKKNAPAPEGKPLSWAEFFSSEIKTISSMRISLLSFYKLYARYSHLLSKGLEFFVSIKALQSLLKTYLPSLAPYPKATALCASLLYYYGPSALHTIFPENAWKLISSIYAFYYEVIGYLKLRMNRLVMKTSIYHLLGPSQIAEISQLIRDTQQKATRDGEISYEILGRREQPTRYHFIAEKIPFGISTDRKKENSTKQPPIPTSILLTKTNLISELNSWVQKIEGIDSAKSSYYLNSQVRNLPVPKQGNNRTLWDEIEDIPTTLESLHSLAVALHANIFHDYEETIVSLFTIYAIIDYLARRSPETHLTDEWKPNGCDLMLMMRNPFIKIKRQKTYQQLESLAAYFDFDIKKRYTLKEINEKRADSLFNYHGFTKGGILSSIPNWRRSIPIIKGLSPDYIHIENVVSGSIQSSEEKYYRTLLNDPSIQRKLEAHLGKEATDWEKYFCLFSDPSIEKEFDSKRSREGILPRPFSILRFMHTLLASEFEGKRKLGIRELSLTPQINEWKIGWPLVDNIVKKGKEILHSVSLHVFRGTTLHSNIPYAFSRFKEEENLYPFYFNALNKHPWRATKFKEVHNLTMDLQRLFFESASQKQDEKKGKKNSEIGEVEKKILEMVTSHKSDQIIRAIGYFSHNLERFADPEFTLIFDLFVHNIGALQSQLSDHPEVAVTLGKFLEKGINHFYQNQDYLRCLYLIQVGGEILDISQNFNPEAIANFPNFRSFIRDKIIPVLAASAENRFITFRDHFKIDLLLQSLSCLASSYENMDPSEDEEVIIDIARYLYCLIRDVEIEYGDKGLWIWEPILRKTIASNPSIRRKIIETLLKDGNIPLPQSYDGNWIGDFPLYQSGGLKIDLHDHRGTYIHQARNHVNEILGRGAGKCIPLSETLISFPSDKILVETFSVRKFITLKDFGKNGIRCRLTSCKEETKENIWIEEDPKSEIFLVVFTDEQGKEIAYNAKFIQDPSGKGIELLSRYPLHDETENSVDLTKHDHGLSLLSWFQPLEKIAAFSSFQNPEKISRIEFPQIKNGIDSSQKLVFTVENNKALSQGTFPGFYLSSMQKDQKLASYSDYLLLENENQEKKVLLVAHPIQAHLLTFFAKHFGQLSSSPFAESLLKSSMEKKREEDKYFVYTLSKEGKLETSDPTALAYLFIHHFIHGDKDELLRILGKLEAFGKLYLFPDSALDLLQSLSLPLLTMQTDFMNEVSLRLSSIQYESKLFHPKKGQNNSFQASDLDGAISLKFLDYFLTQSKYVAYLNGLKQGKSPYLTEYQELFLLKKLEAQNLEFLQSGIPDNRLLKNLAQSIGLDIVGSKIFLMPIVAERSFYLRSKSGEENGWRVAGESLLHRSASNLLGITNEHRPIEAATPSPQKEEKLEKSTLVKVVHSICKHSFSPFHYYSQDQIKQFLLGVSVSPDFENPPLELWEITPKIIEVNFLLYYRLSTKCIPEKWKGNQEKEALFARQVATFQKSIFLLKGKYSGFAGSLIPVLQTVSKGSSLIQFPPPLQMEEVFKRCKELAICNNELSKDSFREDPDYQMKKKVLTSRIYELEKTKMARIDDFFYFFCKDFFERCKNADLSHQLLNKQIAQLALNKAKEGVKWFAPTLLLSTLGLGQLGLLYQAVQAGMGQISTIYQTALFSFGLLRNVVNMNEVPRVQEEIPKETLSTHLTKAMTQKEGQINFVMDELFAKYFVEENENGDNALPGVEIPPFITNDKEESIVAAFSKLTQTVQDYYARPQVMNMGCRLKEGKDPLKLKKKIDTIQNGIHSYLILEEKEILSLVNPILEVEGQTEGERMKNKLRGLIKKETPLTFEKVSTLFAMGKEEELLKRKGVAKESLEIIKEKLYFRLLLLSRFNLLAKTAREKGVNEIGKELKRRRVYTFANAPEKLVRGKLLFEANQQVLLWDKPNKQLDIMLFSPHKQSVLELIMASGKSFCIIPTVSYYEADGKQLICNIWPSPVAKNAIHFIGAQAKKVFNQTASAFQCNRSIQWTLSSLWAAYQVFKRTLFEGEQMNATKEDMQGFELRFLEEGLDIKKTFCKEKDWKEKLSYYMKTLGLIRKSGKANIDEPHIQFEPTKELNYPTGREVRIKEHYIDLMKEILILLVTIPEIKDIVGIKNKNPSPLDHKIFKEKVKFILASHISRLDILNIPEKDQNQLISYIMGNEKRIPPFVLKSEKRSLIALAKGMLTVLLPFSLERIVHVDFAISKKGNGEYARPSEGNDNPIENADIRNPYEAFVKTGLLKLQEGLTKGQIIDFLHILKNKGKKEAGKKQTTFQNTTQARFFKKICPEHELFTVLALPDDQLDPVIERFQKSDIITMTYTAWVIGPAIKYFLHNLKSDSYNFASMFSSFYSYDGSPNKEGCFPHKTHVHWDKGTTGESIDFLVKSCSKESSICILKKETPHEVLEELLGFFQKNPNMRTIIDRGAILNGICNEKVAKVLQSYIETSRKDLDGVDFYNLDKEHVILEKGAKKPIRFEESRIPKEKRITYFDQCHTYAADVPQQENAEGVISIGPDLTLEELTQAIWRMRGLKNANQKLTFVMTEKVKKLISGDKKPTIEEIITFAARNEAHLLAEYNYSADRQKLHNIIRRAILDKIIFAKNVDQALAIMQEFKDVLMTKIEDDPFLLYGYIDTFEKPTTLIDELRTTLSGIIENSSTFTIAEKVNINHELNQIGHATYPEKVHAYKIGDKLYGNKLDDLGKSTQIEVDGTSEIENDEHQEVDQNIQQQSNKPSSNETIPNFWPWPENLIPSNLQWLQVQEVPGSWGVLGGAVSLLSGLKRFTDQVPIFSLKEALQSAVDPAIREIAGAIDPSILATNNFIQLIDRGMRGRYVDPYSKDQKPTFEALIIQEEKNGKKERTTLLFDQKEADYWRNKLREEKKEETITNPHVKLGLYDLVSQTLVISGKNPLTNNELKHPLFDRIQLQLNFLGARVNYNKDEQKILLPWIQKNNPDKMKAAFLNIHEHHGISPFAGSDIEDLFYMAKGIPHEHRIRV